jgi:hypothetical protein
MTDFFIIVSARHCPFEGDPDFFIFFASLASFARRVFWGSLTGGENIILQNEPESQNLTHLNSTFYAKKISTEPKEPKNLTLRWGGLSGPQPVPCIKNKKLRIEPTAYRGAFL